MGYWIVKVILTPLLRCLYRLDVVGAHNLPARGPVIVAANHQSFIDSIFIPLVVRRRVTFVAKAEYFERRRTSWFFRGVGQIPMKRGGGSAAERALASAREVLAADGVLGIYPEGTRSPDGRLYKGHTGVARLALAGHCPVVPVALAGTAAIQPIGVVRPRVLRRVVVRIGTPLRWSLPADAAEHPAALRLVTDEIMGAIAGLSGQARVDEYARRSEHGPSRAGADGRAPAGRAGGPGEPQPGQARGSTVDLTDGVVAPAPTGDPRTTPPETTSFRR